VRRRGFRVLHRDQAAFDADIAKAEAFGSAFGVKFAALTPRDLTQAEPCLIDGGLGALHWLEPWTVSDPGALVTSYADLFKRLGGRIVRGEAQTLTESRAGWSVVVEDGRIEVETAVVALGPWSPAVLKRFGYRIPMVRKRGYHRTMPAAARLACR
jgi:D-amino-acid dehydrogenase